MSTATVRPRRFAAFAGDPSNAPDWYANIRSVDWRTPPPVALGSRMDFVAHFLGRRLAYTSGVVELEPARQIVMCNTDGFFPMETTYTWKPVGSGKTRMTLCDPGNPSGFSRMAASVLERVTRVHQP